MKTREGKVRLHVEIPDQLQRILKSEAALRGMPMCDLVKLLITKELVPNLNPEKIKAACN